MSNRVVLFLATDVIVATYTLQILSLRLCILDLHVLRNKPLLQLSSLYKCHNVKREKLPLLIPRPTITSMNTFHVVAVETARGLVSLDGSVPISEPV